MAKGTIRRAQITDTYGVGALVDVNGEGFVITDINRWERRPNVPINLPRLSQAVGNKQLLGFPPSDKVSVSVDRFPRWYFCPNNGCRTLRQISKKHDSDNMTALRESEEFFGTVFLPPTPRCPKCKKMEMTPMRWIAFCDHGHLAEIDWYNWCHFGQQEAQTGQCDRTTSSLTYVVTGAKGGDFDQLIIKCSCGKRRSLEGIKSDHEFRGYYVFAKSGTKCTGTQPWERESPNAGQCEEAMRVEPRGSSALYRSKKFTALDLGADHSFGMGLSTEARSELNQALDGLVEALDGLSQELTSVFENEEHRFWTRIDRIADRHEVTTELCKQFIIDTFHQNLNAQATFTGESQEIEGKQSDLLLEEFDLFRKGENIAAANLNIVFTSPQQFSRGKEIGAIFSSIGAVRKLKEVRALLGFNRGAGTSSDQMVPVDLRGNSSWLPAVEAWGEGIYFGINPDSLLQWERSQKVGLDVIRNGQLKLIAESEAAQALEIYADIFFLLAHTLSHLLVRELTFQSGYSSSALRERLYYDPSTREVGILIYTTDADAEGTLGGLVEQAREVRLIDLVNRITSRAVWCSLDPVCRETEQQGIGGLNSAACHSCGLIAETSCVYQNAGLNRLLLGGLGDEHGEVKGFLEYVLD